MPRKICRHERLMLTVRDFSMLFLPAQEAARAKTACARTKNQNQRRKADTQHTNTHRTTEQLPETRNLTRLYLHLGIRVIRHCPQSWSKRSHFARATETQTLWLRIRLAVSFSVSNRECTSTDAEHARCCELVCKHLKHCYKRWRCSELLCQHRTQRHHCRASEWQRAYT